MLTDLTGGIHEIALSGLAAGTRYNAKILDDEGTAPAAWGDPEVPDNGGGSPDNWFKVDGAGTGTLSVDRNMYDDGFFPSTDRITFSTDTAFLGYYATGSWETEAGGAMDNSGGVPAFQMSNMGGDLWGVDVTISDPGTYSWKATADDGVQPLSAYQFQWGNNGRNNSAEEYSFVTVVDNQDVTFLLDLAKGAISFSTDTFLLGDTDADSIIEFEDDFFPIRDNWLTETFLRANGNLNNTGESEGVVDITDFREWKNACAANPGTCILPGGGMGAVVASLGLGAVPEPGSAALVVAAGLGLMAGARNRRLQATQRARSRG